MMALEQILKQLSMLAKTKLPTTEQLDAFTEMAGPVLNDFGTDIDSDDYKQIISFYSELYESSESTARVRAIAATHLFVKCSGLIPGSGLPLSDPQIAISVKWSLRILDIPNPSDDQVVFLAKLEQISWLSGLYERRGRLDLAIELYEKHATSLLNSSHIKCVTTGDILLELAHLRQKLVKPEHTLQSPEVIAFVQAMNKVIGFYSNIPESQKTMELYITPGQALQQLDALTHARPFQVTDGDLAQEESTDNHNNNPDTVQGNAMWDFAEKWHIDRQLTVAKGTLGKFLAITPKSVGDEPDYLLAAQWLRAANGRRYTYYAFIEDALEIPQIKAAMAQLRENPSSPSVPLLLSNANSTANRAHSQNNRGNACQLL